MLIIWDMDGTLINSLPSTLEAINDALHPYLGERLAAHEITKHFGIPEHGIIARILEERSAKADPVECYAKFLVATTTRLTEVTPFPGIPETLADLSGEGHTLAIFTGRGRRGTDLILNHLKMHTGFAEIVTADEVENTKPNPEGIHKICARLKTDYKRTLMIGDSTMDILAAQSAGVRSIGCTWDQRANRAALLDAGASHIVDTPSGIRRLIEP